MNQTLTQIQEEFEKKFPLKRRQVLRSYAGNFDDDPYIFKSRPKVKDIKSFLTQSNLRVLEKVKEWAENHPVYLRHDKKDPENVLTQTIDKADLLSFLSTLIEQK